MKTAISMPDETFEKASHRAHDLGMIRTSRPTAMACAMPPAALSAKQASPGDHLTVTVSYVLACQDTNPGEMTVTKERFHAVKIRLIQDNAQTTLATVEAAVESPCASGRAGLSGEPSPTERAECAENGRLIPSQPDCASPRMRMGTWVGLHFRSFVVRPCGRAWVGRSQDVAYWADAPRMKAARSLLCCTRLGSWTYIMWPAA